MLVIKSLNRVFILPDFTLHGMKMSTYRRMPTYRHLWRHKSQVTSRKLILWRPPKIGMLATFSTISPIEQLDGLIVSILWVNCGKSDLWLSIFRSLWWVMYEFMSIACHVNYAALPSPIPMFVLPSMSKFTNNKYVFNTIIIFSANV